MRTYKYEAAPFFMLRTNVLPFDMPSSEVISSRIFKEAIQLVSSNLYSSFLKNENGESLTQKQKRHLDLGLLKYSKRITNRPTPFGLFSYISFGEIDSNCQLSFKNINLIKGVTVDFEWFLKILQIYEKDIVYKGSKAYIQKNNMVYHMHNVYILDEKFKYGRETQSEIETRFILKETPLLADVMKLIQRPISVEKLLEQLNKNHGYTIDQYQKYIQELIDNEFIVTELRPAYIDNNAFNNLLEKVEKRDIASNYTDELKRISNQLKLYESQKIALNYNIYDDLSKRMKAISRTEMPLRIDLRNTDDNNTPKINFKYANTIIDSLEKLLILTSTQPNYPWLKTYTEKFLEQYGVDQIVQVNKVLDATFGIGYPEGYLKREMIFNKKEETISTTSKLLDEIWQKKLLLGETSLELSNDDFKNIEDQNDTTQRMNLPNSGDIYFQVLKNKSDEHENKYILSSIIGSLSAGSTFGRFWYLLNKSERTEIEKFQDNVPRKEDFLYVEISEMPSFGKNGNVMNNHGNLRQHMMLRVLNEKDNTILTPDDIYVGATLDNLYLYSRKYEKKLYFTANNMLNFNYCSHLYRFLIEISLIDTQIISPLSLNSEEVYMPRIEWNNVILRLASWKFSEKDFLKKKKIDFKKLKKFQVMYKMPQYVLLSSGDNQIPLNLESQEDLNVLKQEILRRDRCLLVEDFLRNNVNYEPIVKVNNQKYQSEFVLPFKKVKSEKKKDDFKYKLLIEDTEQDELAKFCRNDWFYVELELPLSQEKKVLQTIRQFITNLKKEYGCVSWFFINYKNKENHTLRIRMHSNSTALNKYMIEEQFLEIFKLMYNYGMVKDYIFKNYIPEIYRYGGLEILSHVEKFFEYDSELAILQKQLTDTHSIQIINGLVNFKVLKAFGLSMEQIIETTESKVNQKIKKESRSLTIKAKGLYRNDPEFLLKLFPEISKKVDEEINLLQIIKEKAFIELNEPRRMRLVNSLLHMHSNRVNGIDILKEGEAIALANIFAKEVVFHNEK